ncbi:excisionase family DNA-binding protein [Ammoniphilus sp. YIM 78166]|uniref:excisionase family DNA-binding protein n=1 Tax=Ammoniphilus sp. YIM 78166 TaxID=1644106 RepID=UPI00106F3B9B|nr:excisionase family DNA-binding protein [Ammoniphilus sp. YIM 78166]
MYLTIKETAEYLNFSEDFIKHLIREKRIRALFDGEQFLINKEQFNDHLEQMEKWKKLMELEAEEGIPEDIDYKDED